MSDIGAEPMKDDPFNHRIEQYLNIAVVATGERAEHYRRLATQAMEHSLLLWKIAKHHDERQS